MTSRRRPADSRLAAARYAADREADAVPADRESPAPRTAEPQSPAAFVRRADARREAVEVAIQQAMRRGDFDGLSGSGRPIPDLGRVRDPDWWIRRKIEREGLTGFAPPALTLRTEDAGLHDGLDALPTEAAVRAAVQDFNRRVREARRQLLGGPPVLVEYRDVDAEALAWQGRRVARRTEQARQQAEDGRRRAEALAAMSWRERRRARRASP